MVLYCVKDPDKGRSGMNAMTLLLFLVTFLAVSEFPPSRVLAQSFPGVGAVCASRPAD